MTVSEYNTCVKNYSDSVYRFIYKNIRDEDRAKDIVQDTFEKMWLKIDSIISEKAKSYLFTAAYNTMIDAIRKDKHKATYQDHYDDYLVTNNGYNDLKKVIDLALNKLNNIQKSVIMLRDYEGYSYEEIGKITGLNESQVKVYIYRARLNLKEFIGSLENVV
ncbi:MAG: RNA polymerase sigma factor [Bacteroidota bacterium]|jgi:RNA polymerase sigma-70 factor (ECF subfamily)